MVVPWTRTVDDDEPSFRPKLFFRVYLGFGRINIVFWLSSILRDYPKTCRPFSLDYKTDDVHKMVRYGDKSFKEFVYKTHIGNFLLPPFFVTKISKRPFTKLLLSRTEISLKHHTYFLKSHRLSEHLKWKKHYDPFRPSNWQRSDHPTKTNLQTE